MAGNVIHVDDAQFEETVENASGYTLIDFWAEWCGPCKAMAPVFEKLSEKYEGKVAFAKVNVDEAGATAAKYGIMSIPSLVLFKDGKNVDQVVGHRSEEDLAKWIDEKTT